MHSSLQLFRINKSTWSPLKVKINLQDGKMEHPQSWCIAALPLGDAAYLTKTWCYFAFWRIHSQTTFKPGSQLVLKCFFFFLDYFFPHGSSLPWQSAGVLVPMMSSLSLPATTRGHSRALIIHWKLPLLTFSAGDRLLLLICCAFALFDLPRF